MARKARQSASSDVRRRLLEAARAEFMQHGYEQASINRILESAGIHKGSLYHYFEDKADLFVTVVRDSVAEMIQTVAELDLDRMLQDPPQDFWGFMERASLQKIAFAVHHPGLVRLGSDLFVQAAKPGAPAKFRDYMRESRDLLAGFLKMGQDQGAVRTDLPVTLLADLGFAVSEIMNRALLEDPTLVERFSPAEIRGYSRTQLDMMRRMLSVPQGGTHP